MRLFLILIFFSLNTIAQRTISFSQWVDEMEKAQGVYNLENANIVYNSNTDQRFNAKLYKTDSLNYLIPVDSIKFANISSEVSLKNVEFVGASSVQIYKINFLNKSHFENIKGERVYFDESLFGNDVVFQDCKIDRLTISISAFKRNLEISDNEIEFLTFNKNKFYGDNNIYDDKTDIVFNYCQFLGNENASQSYVTHLNVGTSHGTENQLKISNCYFKKSHELDLINLGNSKFTNLTLINDTIDVLLWMPFLRTKSIYFAENQFNNKIDFTNVSLPTDDSNIRWHQLKNKIVVNNGYKTNYRNYKPYQGIDETELDNSFKYSELVAAYSKFCNLYKFLSDAESANECYIEMKDLETRRLAHIYKANPSTQAFFAWKVNEFLKYFCKYGTDPSVSIIISIKVILLFSFLYFFIPSVNDNLKKERVLATLNRYIIYTTTYNRFSDISKAEHEEEYTKLENLRLTLEELSERVPTIIKLIGRQFYWLSMLYYRISFWFLEINAVSSEIWYKLPPKQKVYTGSIITLRLSAFIAGGFLMRCINSLTLSLICFVSLGYGEMSPKGNAKYLSALQGVIGWFLLSIFSVSLIGQILN